MSTANVIHGHTVGDTVIVVAPGHRMFGATCTVTAITELAGFPAYFLNHRHIDPFFGDEIQPYERAAAIWQLNGEEPRRIAELAGRWGWAVRACQTRIPDPAEMITLAVGEGRDGHLHAAQATWAVNGALRSCRYLTFTDGEPVAARQDCSIAQLEALIREHGTIPLNDEGPRP